MGEHCEADLFYLKCQSLRTFHLIIRSSFVLQEGLFAATTVTKLLIIKCALPRNIHRILIDSSQQSRKCSSSTVDGIEPKLKTVLVSNKALTDTIMEIISVDCLFSRFVTQRFTKGLILL